MNRITERYQQFKKAVDRTLSGEWSAADFAGFLEQVAGLLYERGRDIRGFVKETGYDEDSPEEVRTGLSGVDAYEAGMEEMARYLQDGDPRHLREGLGMIWDGNEKINEAMEINRESREDVDVTFFM